MNLLDKFDIDNFKGQKEINIIPKVLVDEWNKAKRIEKKVIVKYLRHSFLGTATTKNTSRQIVTVWISSMKEKNLKSEVWFCIYG